LTRIAVISVLYSGGAGQERWARALDDARRGLAGDVSLDVIAVDNSPGPDPGAVPQGARVIRPGRNVGFAAGCNLGLEAAGDATLVVLLNPDVEVGAEFLGRLASLSWPDDLAARGPQVLTPAGEIEQSARGFPSARTGVLGRTSLLARLAPRSRLVQQELRAEPDSGARPVDWVSGACLIAPRERFRSVGPLDEGYFMYWEDADWCRRAHDRGMRVEYEPALTVVHHQGSSSASRPFMSIVVFHRSAFRYWRLHVGRSRAATALAGAALALRCAVKLAGAAARGVRR
jgi:N-acetylglucosaminyl-diphospho-decaprenol L-rhamnosyltransferase